MTTDTAPSATYDPVEYWGRAPTTQRPLGPPALLALLRRLRYDAMLDVGCGSGRWGVLLSRARPYARYTGIDISPLRAEIARSNLPDDARVECVAVQDFDADGERWPLVLAVEVLMHIPPGDVEAAAAKLREVAGRHIVLLDWVDGSGIDPAPHNFVHDYLALLGTPVYAERIGRQALMHWEQP